MAIHELKCWPEMFTPILTGEKTFELRKDDRGFRVGDVVRLLEWRRLQIAADGTPIGHYTGRELSMRVSYTLSGWGLEPGYMCLALQRPGAPGGRTDGD